MNRGESSATSRGFRRQQREQSAIADERRAHGWWRRGEDVQAHTPSKRSNASAKHDQHITARRRNRGSTMVVVLTLAFATSLGLLHVNNRLHLLELAQEVGELTQEYDRLRDRREQLEAERAFLAHPAKIRREAQARLGMQSTPPERIQHIRLKANSPTGRAPTASPP